MCEWVSLFVCVCVAEQEWQTFDNCWNWVMGKWCCIPFISFSLLCVCLEISTPKKLRRKILLAPSFLGILQEAERFNLVSKPSQGWSCPLFTLLLPETLSHSAVPFQIGTCLSPCGISNESSDFWESTSSRAPILPLDPGQHLKMRCL